MRKTQDPNNTIENRRRFRAIQRLCNRYPPQTAAERLEKIAGIADRSLSPDIVMPAVSTDLAERLAAGAASRSARVGDKPTIKEQKRRAKEKKRKEKTGRDRMEGPSFDRTTDLNV